jgi:hypothetical protein
MATWTGMRNGAMGNASAPHHHGDGAGITASRRCGGSGKRLARLSFATGGASGRGDAVSQHQVTKSWRRVVEGENFAGQLCVFRLPPGNGAWPVAAGGRGQVQVRRRELLRYRKARPSHVLDVFAVRGPHDPDTAVNCKVLLRSKHADTSTMLVLGNCVLVRRSAEFFYSPLPWPCMHAEYI